MTDVAESAHVRLLLADYAAVDSAGKINIIGAGIEVLAFDDQRNASVPFTVVARVSFGPQFAGQRPAIELQLEHQNGDLVALPSPVGGVAQPQYVRVAASGPLETPAVPGLYIPPGVMRPHANVVLNFANGLPLITRQIYRWRIKIDHVERDEWTTLFYMPVPAGGAVVG